MEGFKSLLAVGFAVGADLELELMGEMGLGRNVSEKVGHVGEHGLFGTEIALQVDAVFDFCFRHIGGAGEDV